MKTISGNIRVGDHAPVILGFLFTLTACLILSGCQSQAEVDQANYESSEIHRYALILEPLLNIEKLDGLAGKRAATPRLRKACYWLEKARSEDVDPGKVIAHAHNITSPQSEARLLTAATQINDSDLPQS